MGFLALCALTCALVPVFFRWARRVSKEASVIDPVLAIFCLYYFAINGCDDFTRSGGGQILRPPAGTLRKRSGRRKVCSARRHSCER